MGEIVTTPTRWRRVRRETLAELRRIRACVAEIRPLLRSESVLEREEAEGLLCQLWHEHNLARASLRWMRCARVEKNSHISRNAAARKVVRHG